MARELFYTKSHEWVEWISETEAYVGLSAYASESLGDIVYVSVEEDDVTLGDSMGDIESVKAVSDLYSPFDGEIVEVNEEVLDNAGLINEDPENTWICKIANITEKEELLSKEEYEALDKE